MSAWDAEEVRKNESATSHAPEHDSHSVLFAYFFTFEPTSRAGASVIIRCWVTSQHNINIYILSQ